MPGEEVIRWSQLPREYVELTQDEIDLAKAIQAYLRDAKFLWGNLFEASNPEGESPILSLQRMRRQLNGWGADVTWFDDVAVVPRGIPRQEVNLSPEAMREMRNALLLDLDDDAPLGTSGDLDPRGYWMPIDGEASR